MIWKSIPDWPRYEASSAGYIRSKDMFVGAKGGALALRKGRVLSPATKTNGYLAVTLTEGKTRKQECVHRLIALAFLGAPDTQAAHVLHGDGDKRNNSADNLRWGTPAENHLDTERHGRRRKGATHPHAKLTLDAVKYIRQSDEGASLLASKFDVSREHIWAVRKNRIWKHVV